MIIRRDGRVIEVEGQAELKLKNGDIFVIETPGGGGYGRHVPQSHKKNLICSELSFIVSC